MGLPLGVPLSNGDRILVAKTIPISYPTRMMVAMKTLKAGDYLTTVQAARRLKLSDARVRQFCREGRIGVKVGRNYLIPEEHLQLVSCLPTGRPRRIPKKTG